MIIDTTNDELLINGQRWQRGGYLQATAYATEQINITARDGRVIGKALQWDAIYDQDKNLFGLDRDGVLTALTTVFDSRVKSPYNLEALRDVQDGTASYGDILIWSAPGEWQYDTLTQYHHAYNSEAAALRAGATATTELYYTAQADGDGLSESAQSNTPASGYQILRKLYYSEAAQADPDTGTWVQFAELSPNTTYASAKATLLAYLKERTGGTVPISLKMTWEEELEPTLLLDTYTGAAAAYSLRKLRTAYSGSAIRVRRASDNAEQDIGFSSGELDTAALASFCSGTDGFVKTWYDQASTNDATQTSTASQPQIVSSGSVITQNGKPTLNFDGTDTFNIGSSDVYNQARLDTYCYMQSGDSNHIMFSETTGSSNYSYGVREGNTSTMLSSGYSDASSKIYVNGSDINVIQGTTTRDDLHTAIITNGAANSNGAIVVYEDVFTTGWTDFKISAYTFFTYTGKMSEILLYNSDQSSNRTGIESNINTFYSIY